jgi:localization factor PodJL
MVPGNLAAMPPTTFVPARPASGLPPILSAPGAQLSGAVTGSISRPAARVPTAPPPLVLPETHSSTERLPAAIGGIRLRSAATAGDAAAAYEIGQRFAEGQGVPADMAEAARWFERAATKGLAPAQFRYGSFLEKGRGVKKDLAQARQLYLAAGAAGNAKAMHNLAVLYAEGVDAKPDYAAAAQWFRKAADRGIADSQFNLGVLYARGLGVSTNLSESYKWFALAAGKGDKEAVKKRDEIAARLDPHALAAAQVAAKNFAAEPQPDAAINVPSPPGGWDNAAAAPAPRAKPHVGAPMVLGKR